MTRATDVRRRSRTARKTGGGTDLPTRGGPVGLRKYVVAQRGPCYRAGKVARIHRRGESVFAGATL